MKQRVAQEIAKRISTGAVIGVGTGSTVDAALDAIAARVRSEKLVLSVLTTSIQSAQRCQAIGLTVLHPCFEGMVDWGFDGADEVDEKMRLIKGRGGAMLQEKIVAAKCKKFVVIVDESKCVQHLGQKCPVPVEVIPSAVSVVRAGLTALGAGEVVLRQAVAKHGPVITEAGNVILDVRFSKIEDDMERKIKSITGVVDSGLFIGIASEVLIARGDGVYQRTAAGEKKIA